MIKVFISYAWTDEAYKQKVLELATKLRNKGFDIRPDVLTVEEIKDEILKVMRGRKKMKKYNVK